MPESKLIKATKWFYKAVRSPPQESFAKDPCYKKMCAWDEICMHNTTTNLAECYPFCKNPPVIPWTRTETTEMEVGQNYTYRCQDGLFGKRDQIPTVTCLRDGQWTATNFTCGNLTIHLIAIASFVRLSIHIIFFLNLIA
ncbi:hypothetical protein CHS0354_002873 [Potamilus streckersoni]|uniref:Sushi domain-containing protein n=1 Tax=Potamilus streckersoni TaxID=2493646 RepID=A0AAE0VYI4_9BIVA|nr:hypothetical protein CHS0354_002873 [Potamilus streckersoni]